jgi:hypothetical protein
MLELGLVKTEKAVLVEGHGQLGGTNLSSYNRLYFGHETCERRIPALSDLKRAKRACEDNSVSFSLVTPFCTNEGASKLLPLLRVLSSDDEIIVNDFGVMRLALKESVAEVVCGRLLNRQYRDPRIALFKGAPQDMLQHLRLSHAASPIFQQMLKEFGVKRVELDNLLQGIGTSLCGGLNGSLYYPLVFIAATRLCLTANCDKLLYAKRVGVFPCGRECLAYSFRLESTEFNKPLFLFGNAVYFENKTMPADLGERGIDRIVYTAAHKQL